MPKILLIEDDIELATKIQSWLTPENKSVEIAATGNDALQLLSGFQYDLIILDWSLPDISGLQVLEKFRGANGKTPILFLTGRGEMDCKLAALEAGADDYMIKPFDVRELAARIKSLLRRPADVLQTELKIGDVVLKVESKTLICGDETLTLRSRECALLEYLMRNPDRPHSGKALLGAVWPSDSESTEESVRTCVKILRNKLKQFGQPELLKTVLGSGYIVESKQTS